MAQHSEPSSEITEKTLHHLSSNGHQNVSAETPNSIFIYFLNKKAHSNLSSGID
jgi:hypothetical protein